MSTTSDIAAGASRLCDFFSTCEPALIGRNGTIELQVLYFWVVHRRSAVARGGADALPYPPHLADILERHAGVFPRTDASIDAWAAAYADALGTADQMAAGWYKPLAGVDRGLLEALGKPGHVQCPLRSLEPYYVDPAIQWPRHLSGARVCVVSSFADTIERQTARLDAVWPAGLFPPDVAWSTIRTGYSPRLALGTAGWPEDVLTWQDAVVYVTDRIHAIGPDIVIIGCGALGMIIGAAAKKLGCRVLVLGGATQVLFGIKGRRWAQHEIISGFWNGAWVWPSESETPKGADQIEGGCYWG